MTSLSGLNFSAWRTDVTRWGRLVESAIGAHLVNSSIGSNVEIYYWRDRDKEVDFILKQADKLIAIEVKSGSHKGKHSGLMTFIQRFPGAGFILVGQDGISVEEFLSHPIMHWMRT